MNTGSKLIVLLALAGAGAVGAYHYNQAGEQKAQAKSQPAAPARGVPVTVAQVEQKDVPVTLNLVGRAEAWASVTLRSRIDGQIVAVHYQAGQPIARGQKMVTFDGRALQAQLAQAQANLARDRAQLEKARADFGRYSDLVAKGFVSASQLETYRAAVDSTDAVVKADIAARDLATVQLGYTTVTAPMDGVAGAVLVFPGGSVKANDTSLVVINQIRPIYVTFSVPERMLAQIGAERSGAPMQVSVAVPGGQGPKMSGALTFIDNAVDATTGTIVMKARIDNADQALTPGQFVEISMVVRRLSNALVVPSEALQSGPEGNFIYVAKPDQTVEVRKVQTLALAGRDLVVEKGLAAGEQVVTDGQLRLSPGARYEVRGPARTAPAAPPAATDKAGTAAAAEKK